MVFLILFAFLAGFGALSLIWVILGWFLPKVSFVLVFRCPKGCHPDGAIGRCRWLQGLGLVRGPLVIVGDFPEKEQKIWKRKHSNVEFLSPEVIASVPELERTI